jgi:hypothetical protein
MPTLVHSWSEAARQSVQQQRTYGDRSLDNVRLDGNIGVSDLIIGSRGQIPDTQLLRADEVLHLGSYLGVEMVATYQHGEMASEETLVQGAPLYGYATCETYGRCSSTVAHRMYVGSRCSHRGLEGLCYASSARTLECGRTIDVHSRYAPTEGGVLPATLARTPLYASGLSFQTHMYLRPCPWGSPAENGAPTGLRIVSRRVMLAGCMLSNDTRYSPTAEVHVPHACAVPRAHPEIGCMFPAALNYQPGARQVGPCQYITRGCIDSTAINFNVRATEDDGSCIAAVRGCTLPSIDPFSAAWNMTRGANASAPTAVVDKIGRTVPPLMRPRSVGTPLRGMVPFPQYGAAVVHDPAANVLDGCVIAVEGCMDSTAANYDLHATLNQGSWCVPRVVGCMDPSAFNYNPLATVNNVSTCVTTRRGCTSPTALNFDMSARHPGVCYERVQGCLDPAAFNYRCGYGGSELLSPCAMDSSHADLAGARTATSMVTVHQPLVCNMYNSSAVALSEQIDHQIALAISAAALYPGITGRDIFFRLLIEFVADATVDEIASTTVASMHRTFVTLHPTRDARRTFVTFAAGSVVFRVAFEVATVEQLQVAQANLIPHAQSRAALGAFLALTGAPSILTCPRFNVSWGVVGHSAGGQPLTIGESLGISAAAIAVAGIIGAGVCYFFGLPCCRRISGAGGAKVLPHVWMGNMAYGTWRGPSTRQIIITA